MKKLFFVFVLSVFALMLVGPSMALAYDFGDHRSVTLTSKAWGALKEDDLEGVLAYTNKCLELYSEQAKEMQTGLEDYPTGTNDEIFEFWALNDVATCLFIQAEAYRRADMKEEAVEVYKTLINEYTFGQAWDANGWFWKPAEAAKEKLAMLETGEFFDFGDYSSSFLTSQAWKALENDSVKAVEVYTNKILELYGEKAKSMQESLTEYPWQSREQIFNYWALNDVGTALYIQGEAYKNAGELKKAKESYKKLVDEFFYAQCWDPKGWFWKPAENAQQTLDELSDI